jgi:transcriptional regulator with PAS, ATPase and Fis domain
MEELGPLRKTMQAIVLRLNELINVNPDVQVNQENDDAIIDQLKNVMDIIKSPCLILDGQRNVKFLNSSGEELLGIRENLTSGQSLFDNLRDQGLAATIMELLQKTESSMGRAAQDSYEIGGKSTEISTVASLGKDGTGRGFLVTFNLV